MGMFSRTPSFWHDRLKASSAHLAISLVIAVLAALLVFAFWYPYPYREISGGRELFLLVVSIDVVLGPLITLAIFNRSKPWHVLCRDLLVIALIQLTALGYGLWTVFVARPVHLVFEIDRFRVVHAIEVAPDLLAKLPPGINALPVTGPTILAVRDFVNEDEKSDATMAALQGVHLGIRPDLWKPYPDAIAAVLKAAKPVALLRARFPSQVGDIEKVIQATGRTSQDLVYLPMIGRKSFWTVLLDSVTGDVVAFIPIDSF